MNRIRLISIAAVIGAGVLLSGIGTGVMLKEYASMEYIGEYVETGTDIQTESGELTLTKEEEMTCYEVSCSHGTETMLKEDASLPEDCIRYEVTYARDLMAVNIYNDPGYISFSEYYHNNPLEWFFRQKDRILEDWKQRQFGSYQLPHIEKIVLWAHPNTAKQIAFTQY